MNRVLTLTLAAGWVLVMSATAGADSFRITLDTSPLAGTQTFGFALTNGNSDPNTVALTAFEFGGGSAIAGTDDCTFGGILSGSGCSGDLSSGITLQDDDLLVFFTQQFQPGSLLSFTLTTTNSFAEGVPDALAMYLCDAGISTCYSDDAATAAMLLLDLTGGTLFPSSFTLHGASAQGLDAPVVNPLTAIPEPTSLALCGIGLVGIAARRYRGLARRNEPSRPVK